MADFPGDAFTSTRSRARTRMGRRVAVLVDNRPAELVDLSEEGAQLICETVIRPGQLVRLTLAAPTRSVRLTALAAWSTFERPTAGGRPQFRAGLQFTGGDVDLVADVCRELGTSSR